MIRQMVDNILREGAEEVGHSSDDNEPDLSGDELKTPIFVIKRSADEESKDPQQQRSASNNKMALDDEDAEFENERSAEEEEMFVQEEYDLANNLE